MAITASPGRSFADVPSCSTVRSVALTLSTARSVTGSRPTMDAGDARAGAEHGGDLAAGALRGHGDHVVVGEDVALGVDHHAGADVPAAARLHLQRHDGGRRRARRCRPPSPAPARWPGRPGRGWRPRRSAGWRPGRRPADEAADPPISRAHDEQDHQRARLDPAAEQQLRHGQQRSRRGDRLHVGVLGVGVRAGGPSAAPAPGSRHGSPPSEPSQNRGASLPLRGPLSFGARCRMTSAASAGRPNAVASASGGGAAQPARSR